METDPVIKTISVTRYQGNTSSALDDAIIDEDVLTLYINQKKAFEMVFSMTHTKELAIGFLFTQGIIETKEDLLDIKFKPKTKECSIHLSEDASHRLEHHQGKGQIKGSSGGVLLKAKPESVKIKTDNNFFLTPGQVTGLIKSHWDSSERFQQTGAVHSAALCSPSCTLSYFEDIGRHNGVDKLAGHILLNRIDTSNKIATVSCRMSLEIVGKIILSQIPILISNAAPTLSAVRLAQKTGLTIIGFARDRRFNVYTHPERIRSK